MLIRLQGMTAGPSSGSGDRYPNRHPLSLGVIAEENQWEDLDDYEYNPRYSRLQKTSPMFPPRLSCGWTAPRNSPVAWCKKIILIVALKRILIVTVFALGCTKFLSLIWDALVAAFPDELESRLDSWTFPGGRPSGFAYWDTHGVLTVQTHSHNDYWQDVPLFSALTAGCVSVEADVWLSQNNILVGHNIFTLHHEQTLRSLYLDPLLDMLQKHNTRSSSLQSGADTVAGVFATDPAQTLVLLIDVKSDGEDIWPLLFEQLEPLRRSGYLSHWNGTDINIRPVTVVASGNAPYHLILQNSTYRDIFCDAPLDQLGDQPVHETSFVKVSKESQDNNLTANYTPISGNPPNPPEYNYTNSYYASVDFSRVIGPLNRGQFSAGQLELIRKQVEDAHTRGLQVRYWGSPVWPRGLRNHVWWVLAREGVDIINADDLWGATRRDWRKYRSWLS